jgi:nucleotide-binding universal stress UspA family protein
MRNLFPLTPLPSTGHHIFLPYFGSEDDKTALRLVLQLAQDPSVTATIVHFTLPEETTDDVPPLTTHSTTVPKSLIARIRSALAPAPQAAFHATYATFFAALRDSLPAPLAPRVLFESAAVGGSPLPDVLAKARTELGQNPRNAGDLVVLGRNVGLGHLMGTVGMDGQAQVSEDAEKVLGTVGAGLARSLRASLLVVGVKV